MDSNFILGIALSIIGGIVSFGGAFVMSWLRGEFDKLTKEHGETIKRLGAMEITLATIVEQLKHKADK